MRTQLLFLVLFAVAYGADTTGTWNASAGQFDANNVNNYSWSPAAPAAISRNCPLVLNATSVVNWTRTASMTAKSLTATSAYTGAIDNGNTLGGTLTLYGSFNIANNGTCQNGGSIAINGGDFILASTGSKYSGYLNLSMVGRGTYNVNGGNWWCQYLKLNPNGDTITSAGSFQTGAWGTVTLGNGDNTGSGVIANNNQLWIAISTQTGLSVDTLITLGGTGGAYYLNPQAAGNYNVPRMRFAGTAAFRFDNSYGGAGVTFQQSGNLTFVPGNAILQVVSNKSCRWNTNGYYILGYPGLATGSNGAGYVDTIDFASSIVQVKGISTTSYNTDSSFLYMRTSQWYLSAGTNIASKCRVISSSCQINFISDGSVTNNDFLTSGNTFADLFIRCTGTASFVFNDTLRCRNLTRVSGKILAGTGCGIYASGNIDLSAGATDSVRIDGPIIMSATGTTKTLDIPSAKTKLSLCSVKLQDSTNIHLYKNVISRLTCAPGRTYRWTLGDSVTITNYTSGNWSGTAGNLVVWTSTGPYKIYPPINVAVQYMDVKFCRNQGDTIDASDGTSRNSLYNMAWKLPPRITGPQKGKKGAGAIAAGYWYGNANPTLLIGDSTLTKTITSDTTGTITLPLRITGGNWLKITDNVTRDSIPFSLQSDGRGFSLPKWNFRF
jgi:hypothetical protein